jgi:hypothetical protein
MRPFLCVWRERSFDRSVARITRHPANAHWQRQRISQLRNAIGAQLRAESKAEKYHAAWLMANHQRGQTVEFRFQEEMTSGHECSAKALVSGCDALEH